MLFHFQLGLHNELNTGKLGFLKFNRAGLKLRPIGLNLSSFA